MNDARLNVGLACTAALVGAAVLNHAEAISLHRDELTDQIVGARIRNNLTGNIHGLIVCVWPVSFKAFYSYAYKW